jgi:hypothetical protein
LVLAQTEVLRFKAALLAGLVQLAKRKMLGASYLEFVEPFKFDRRYRGDPAMNEVDFLCGRKIGSARSI